MKKTKKILMACTNYWTSPFQVGSHHLARQFVRLGYEVAFVSDPISPFHLLGGNSRDFRERFRLYRGGDADNLDGFWTYVPATLFSPHNKPLLRSRFVFRHWQDLTFPNVIGKVKAQGFGEVDVLYLDSVTQSFWMDHVRAKKSVFRIADNNAGFEKWTGPAREMERELAQKVDLVVYAANSLENGIKVLEPKNMFHLPNGVNYKHFAEAEPKRPAEYAGLEGPIAVYVGAMEEWFNFKWLRAAAKALPKLSFVLIGSAKAAGDFTNQGNVRFLGSRPYSEIPAYLKYADLGLIPFDLEGHSKLVNNIHPLKLYEYMACGLPVVSTAWSELESLKSPALLAHNEGKFIRQIRKALGQKGKRARYIAYALKQDWSGRVKMLLNHLEKMK